MNNQPSGLDDFFNSSKDELEEKIKTTISDKKIIEILEDGKRLRPLLAHLIFKVCTRGKETLHQYQKSLKEDIEKLFICEINKHVKNAENIKQVQENPFFLI